MFPIQSSFSGPANQGILIKNRGNNATLSGKMPMPQKFYPSSGGSMFSNARHAYVNDSGGGTILQGNFDQSQYINLRKINAISKSSTKTGLPLQEELSFRSNDQNVTRQKLRRVRSGGSVAPAKKGAIANKYKSEGSSRITGTGNRQIFI